MSYNKDMNKNSYQGSCKGTRNIKPYDKNQSLLSRVKNAVQGYFIPSWVQAVIPPRTQNEIANDIVDPTKNGCIEASETTESSKLGVGFFQNSSQALDEGITSTNLKRRQMDSCSKDGLIRENPATEPQTKRRAIDRNVEFVEDDILSPSFRSTPVARSSIRPLRGFSLATNPSHKNTGSQDPVVKNSSLFSISSKLQTPERPVPMSPFYNGPVAYGGANACRQQAQKSFDGTDSDEHQVLISKRNSNLGLSKTTQKILKVLESSKTQHVDKMGLPPLTFDSERHKSLMTEVFSKGRKSAQGPPVKEMSIPTKLNIKPNYALMNSGTSKCNEGVAQDDKSSGWTGKMRREREKHHEIRGHDTKSNEVTEKDDLNSLSHIKLPPIALTPLSLPPASTSVSASFTSSFARTTAALCTQPSTRTPPDLNTQSSDFKFSLPHIIQGKRCATGNIHSSDMNFKFSEPKSKVCYQSPTPQPIVKSLLSGYQIDFTAAVKKSSQAPASEGLLVGPAKDLKTGSVMDILKKDSGSSNTHDSSQSKCQGSSLKELFKKSSNSVWQCPTCMVSNKVELSVCPCCSTKKPIMSLETPSNSLSGASTTSDISSINNNNTIATLASPATPSSLVSTSCQTISQCEPKKTLSLSAMFSAKPGEWNCDVCMVRNKAEVSKCAACETDKPGSKNSEPGPSSSMKDSNQNSLRPKSGEAVEISKMEPSSSLSALFAAKPGEWNCAVCMVRNKAETTKCAACETDKPGTEAVSDNSKKESAEALPKVVINAGTGGFTFASAVTTDFFKSEPLKKKENEATFGGFRPSFGCINSATASSSSSGFSVLGGGFKFAPSLSQSACSSNSVVQSLPSTSANPSNVIAQSFKTNFNGPSAFTSEQPTKTTSKEENLNNSNSLFAGSKIKAVNDPFDFANNELKSSVASQFQFGSNNISKDSSNNFTFGLPNPQSAALTSAPASTSFFNTSASGFKTTNEKLSSAHFGSSSIASAPTASLKPFTVSSGIVFGQNMGSGSSPSLPMFGHSSIVSGTTIVSNSPSTIFGQNLIDSNTNSMGSNPNLPVFGQNSAVSSINVATNIHSTPMFGQKLTAADTASAGNSAVLPLFGQTSIVTGTTSVANNPSFTLFGQNLTATSTISIGSSPSVPAFAQNVPVSSSTVGAFSFGSSSAGLFAKPQQNSSNLFGQTSQTSSAFGTSTIQAGSGFSFKNSGNATGFFGGTQNSTESAPKAAHFNFGGTRTSSNGDDMMMESPQSTLPPFGFNKTSSDSAVAGFNFGNNNNGSNLFGATAAPTSQGFSFPSVPPSFNFGQAPANPSDNQQTPQWGQPANTAQPFSFGAAPTMNFAAGNVTFSAGSSQGNRVIKKATRRMAKR